MPITTVFNCVFGTAVENQIFVKRAPDGEICTVTFQRVEACQAWRKRCLPPPKHYAMILLWSYTLGVYGNFIVDAQ